MRTIFVILALPLAFFSAGCNHHNHKDYGATLPNPPVGSGDTLPAPTAEPAPTASLPAAVNESVAPRGAAEPSVTLRHSLNELLLELADAYFDLDQHDLRSDAREVLSSDSSVLKMIAAQAASTKILVEGHCDERGSAEYNMALGAMRADAAKEFLTARGIPGAMLQTITYGKERPQCTEQTEECWQKNRRAHLASEQ